MHDLNRWITEQRVERIIGSGNPQRLRRLVSALLAGAENAEHIDAQTAQRLNMNRADKARADHGGADGSGT